MSMDGNRKRKKKEKNQHIPTDSFTTSIILGIRKLHNFWRGNTVCPKRQQLPFCKLIKDHEHLLLSTLAAGSKKNLSHQKSFAFAYTFRQIGI